MAKTWNCFIWPFMWIINKTTNALDFVAKSAKNAYSSVRLKLNNPIGIIEMILETIFFAAEPALKAGLWLCEFIAQMKQEIRVRKMLKTAGQAPNPYH